jgi:hypothetical protein
MQEWGKLTDDERQEAREKYMSTKQVPIEKKRELKKKWEEYSSLPEEERALMDRALAENAVIVAQMEPLYGDEDEE